MSDSRKKTIEYVGIIVWSFLTMLVIAFVSGYGITGIDIILPCIFALCVVVFAKTASLVKGDVVGDAGSVADGIAEACCRKDLRFAIPLGVIADICTVVGSKIDMDERVFNSFGIKDVAFIIILIPFFISLFILLFFSSDVISKKINENGIEVVEKDKKVSFSKKYILTRGSLYTAILMVCWLPYYLTYYPGGIGNDIYECVNMCLGTIPWTNHHPVIFTATMKLFIAIFGGNGNITLALGMMVLTQMIMMAVTMAAMLLWLERRMKSWAITRSEKSSEVTKVCIIVSVIFIALFPIFPMYSIYLTKDISFGCAIVLLVLFLFDFCEYMHRADVKQVGKNHTGKYLVGKKIAVKHMLILGVLSFIVIITRNNGTLVIGLLAIAMLITYKKLWKQLLIVFAAVFLLNGIYKGPIWNAIGIEKQSFVESAAIPLTQIAYTIYTDGVIEGEDRAYLESIMPFEKVKANFLPGYVDSYKFDSAFNTEIVDDNPSKLISVWFHLLPKNFGKYVEGYLLETCGYWHYGISNTLCPEGVQRNEMGDIPGLEGTGVIIVDNDFIGSALGISLSGIITQLMLVVRKLPIICLLSQMAIEILAVVLVGCQYVRRKKAYAFIALVPLIALWISVMIASPAHCLFRYMFPVFMMWPVLIVEFIKNFANTTIR